MLSRQIGQISITALVSKDLFNLSIEWVFSSQPIRMVFFQILPVPGAHQGMENTAGVETINRFNQQHGVITFLDPHLEDLVSRERQEVPIEIIEGSAISQKFLINGSQLLSSSGSDISNRSIRVHPARARAEIEAVQEGIDVFIGGTERVGLVPKGVPKQFTITKTDGQDVRTAGEDTIKVAENGEDVGGELVDGGHAVASVADVISDEFEDEEDGVVVLLVSLEGVLDVADFEVTVTAVDTGILIILEVASVSLEQVVVEGVHRSFRGGVVVSGPA